MNLPLHLRNASHRLLLAMLMLGMAGCTFLNRLNGVGTCDYPSTENLRRTYAVGDTSTLIVGLRDATGVPATCLGSISAAWQSGNPDVVSVSSAGFLTANSVGSSVLSARTAYGTVHTQVQVVPAQ